MSNRILIFLAIAFLIGLFLDNDSFESDDGLIGVHFDNSISSTINDSQVKVENGLRQLFGEYGSMIYFDNQSKLLIEDESDIVLSSLSLPKALPMDLLAERFETNGLTSNYLFSDFQTLNVTEARQYFIDSAKTYNLVIINDLNDIRNVSVDSLYLLPNQDNLSEISIFVQFKTYNMPTGSIVVKLMNGTRQLSSVVKEIGELKEVRFDISKDTYGEFEIVIDGDDVVFDNKFFFSVGERVKPKISILESSNSNILKAVFANKELFDVNVQTMNNLDYNALQVSDLVVFSSQYLVPEVLQNLKCNFIIFPSDSVDVASYEKLIGVSLKSIEENISETTIDSEHPLFKGVFERKVNDQSMLVDGALFRIGGSFESIIKFRGGNSFLSKKDNIYFFNTTLKESSGGFQSSALFLPILFQIAFSSTEGIEIPYYYPGERIFVSAKTTDVPIKLIKNKYEVIPSFNSNGSQTILELPDDLEAGVYQLAQGTEILRSISINTPKAESVMIAPDFDELKEAFADMEHVTVTKIIGGDENVLLASGSQSSLWKYALILAVFLILTETVLHRYLR